MECRLRWTRANRAICDQRPGLTSDNVENLDAEDWDEVLAAILRASREAATVTVPSAAMQRVLRERCAALQDVRQQHADVQRLQAENEDLAHALARYRSWEDDQSFFDSLWGR